MHEVKSLTRTCKQLKKTCILIIMQVSPCCAQYNTFRVPSMSSSVDNLNKLPIQVSNIKENTAIIVFRELNGPNSQINLLLPSMTRKVSLVKILIWK